MINNFLDDILSDFEPDEPEAPATSAEKFMRFLRQGRGNNYELICWYVRNQMSFLDNLSRNQGLVLHTTVALNISVAPAPRVVILRAVIRAALYANHLTMFNEPNSDIDATIELMLGQVEIKRILAENNR